MRGEFDADPTGAAETLGSCRTPAYVYELGVAVRRVRALRRAFGGHFEISYAVKANPNRALIGALASHVDRFDASSIAEVDRILACAPGRPISFTGPGKTDDELARFARLGAGETVVECEDEAVSLSEAVCAEGLAPTPVLLRINPLHAPRRFGARMSGPGSQFGVDEDQVERLVRSIAALPGLRLEGFHCCAATNGLEAEAVAEYLFRTGELFRRCAAQNDVRPSLLVFGAGFGVPYHDGQAELDLTAVAAALDPMLKSFGADPELGDARLVLELGRWIAGPAGYLLTTVLRSKTSGGLRIHVCDAGLNVNQAACGLLGGAFRRNWRIINLSNPDGEMETCDIVGPLCTSLDRLATGITLPAVRKGDVLAVLQSGAYGVSASPTRFISHPEPSEIALDGGKAIDVTEGRLNWLPEIAGVGG